MLDKFFISIAIFFLSFTISANTDDDVLKLKSSNPEKRLEAFKQLVDSRDVKTFPILNAINNKKLFLYNNELITIGKKIKNKEEVFYELIKLYPLQELLTDNKNKIIFKPISLLERIKFSRKDRMLLIPLMPFINLTSLNTELRKLAYTQFQSKNDEITLKIIETAALKETNKTIIRYAKETILAIKLKMSLIEEDQLNLIRALVDNKGENTLYILESTLARSNLTSSFRAKLIEQIEVVKRRSTKISWIQNLFSGLSLGSILILIALGLSIIYGLAGVINMAHGEFMMIGAYTSFCVQELFIMGSPTNQLSDLFFWVSIPIAFLISGAFGLIIEKLVLRKLYGRPLESLLATWGISLVLIQLARSTFGDLTSVKAPSLLSGGWEVVPQLVLPFNRLFIIGLTIIIIVLVFMFLYKTKNGLRIRSVTQNREMSACLGISTKKIDALTFFIGSGLAGIAGCCMTLIGNVVPDMGQTYIVDSFLVVVTGGVGSLFGTITAGLGIGQLTKLLEPAFQAVYGKVIILVIIIFFLQFKPKGLFPAKGRIADE